MVAMLKLKGIEVSDPYVIYLREAEQTGHKAWFLQALLNVEREKEVATEK